MGIILGVIGMLLPRRMDARNVTIEGPIIQTNVQQIVESQLKRGNYPA